MIHARLILDELRKQGVTDVLGVPDNAAKALLDMFAVEPAIRLLTGGPSPEGAITDPLGAIDVACTRELPQGAAPTCGRG